jgi:hypothetical protein
MKAMAEDEPLPEGAAPGKTLTPAARRALEEAAARRAAQKAEAPAQPEQDGPSGPEPTRFGDWERKGLAVDF